MKSKIQNHKIPKHFSLQWAIFLAMLDFFFATFLFSNLDPGYIVFFVIVKKLLNFIKSLYKILQIDYFFWSQKVNLNLDVFVNSNDSSIHSNHWLMLYVHYVFFFFLFFFSFIEKVQKQCSKYCTVQNKRTGEKLGPEKVIIQYLIRIVQRGGNLAEKNICVLLLGTKSSILRKVDLFGNKTCCLVVVSSQINKQIKIHSILFCIGCSQQIEPKIPENNCSFANGTPNQGSTY